MLKVLDKEFELFINADRIQETVQMLAQRINDEYHNKELHVIIVLNGSLFFAVDLLKHVQVPCIVDSIKCSSYVGTQSSLDLLFQLDFTEQINGKNLLILEDIVDTGFTLQKIQERLKAFNPQSCRFASLFFKPEALQFEVQLDYVGLELPNDFVLGYGLDYNGQGRNLSALYRLKS
jgi:hypoxanthine phosphoribosyltransferase